MRNSYLYYKLAIVIFAVVTFAGCSKDNGINNTTVIATPYSLYFSDSAGSLWNTNDGIFFKYSVFKPDGVPSLAIAMADTNLIWIKGGVPVGLVTAHIWVPKTVSFNTTYQPLNPNAVDQTMVLYAADRKRVYIATADGTYSGVKYNDSSGKALNWNDDTYMMQTGASTFFSTITSFTELKDHTIIAIDWNTASKAIFVLPPPPSIPSKVPWQQITPTTPLPSGGQFTLSHFNNTIVAVDRAGINGAWYSQNHGMDWYQYSLPSELIGRKLYCAYAPFESTLLLGTESNGVYVLQGTSFVASSNGLTALTAVRSITAKQNIYVNGVSVQYVYIATSQGIFRSEDLGQNWVPVRAGNYYSIN